MLNSTTKKTFALYTSQKLSAKENMRLDKALFDGFKPSELPILRVYEWEASFTYGISQNMESLKNDAHLTSYGDNHAQRMTGGGILFHGNDISYSLVIPTSFVKGLSVKESYERICGFLMEFYKSLGLHPVYAKDVEDVNLSKSHYCQEGYEPYDILVGGKKVGGNAQRRSKEAIFQHGSISIDNSTYSMGHSLEDLGVKMSFKKAKELLAESFAKTFNVIYEEKNEDIAHAS